MAPTAPLGAHYARCRERLSTLLREHVDDARPVPACPGWTVHDVVSHLVGNIEDGVAGRIKGIPTEEQTADQVERHGEEEMGTLLATWHELSPLFEAALDDRQIWPGMLDALSHEHDVRAALDRPGARDVDTIPLAAEVLVGSVDAPAQVVVELPDGRRLASNSEGERYELRTSAFEVLRLRLGRRSRDQVAALDWSRDPEPVLDHLFVFGPSPLPQEEPG